MLKSSYSRFVAASGFTNLADGIAVVAWAWLASLLTRDPLLVALVPVMLRLPWFFFAIPAGIITDRTDRRRLILLMDIVRAVAFLGAAIAIWLNLPFADAPASGTSNNALFILILIAASVVGVAEVFRDNAAQTMLPSIVPHEDLEKANGRLWSVEMVGNALLGPAVGAFLLAIWVPLPFTMNFLLFLLAVVLVLSLSGNFSPAKRSERDWKAEFREGFEFLKKAPLMRAMAWLTGFWNLLFHMTLIGLVLHSQENLGFDARTYGLVLAAGAIGGIAGGFLGEHVVKIFGSNRAAQLALASSAPAFACMAIAPGPISLGIVLAVFEFTGIVWNTVSVSYRQRLIPDELLGRVNSLYRLLAWGMMPIGLLLSGILVTIFESITTREIALTTPFWAAALGSIMLTIGGWSVLKTGVFDVPSSRT